MLFSETLGIHWIIAKQIRKNIPKSKHRNFCYFHLKQDSSGDFSASSILFSVKNCRAVFIKAALKAEPSSGNSDALSTPVLVGVKTLKVTFNLSSFKRGLRKPRVESENKLFRGCSFHPKQFYIEENLT